MTRVALPRQTPSLPRQRAIPKTFNPPNSNIDKKPNATPHHKSLLTPGVATPGVDA